jgi:hypothetical protein
MKVASIVGNRPQFIKSAPTSLALHEADLDEVVIHTGQHYDRELSQAFFKELGLAEPRYRLDLRTAGPEVMRPPIEACLAEERPDWVLVCGDTNSTLAGLLTAAVLELPLAHVEAGLRRGDLSTPEERNRIETDKLTTLLFCPDERSRDTLAAEGVYLAPLLSPAASTQGQQVRPRSPETTRADLTQPCGFARASESSPGCRPTTLNPKVAGSIPARPIRHESPGNRALAYSNRQTPARSILHQVNNRC